MDTTDAPQILEHCTQSLTFTPFDCRWIPSSARFVVLGQTPKAKGIIQIYPIERGKINKVQEWEKEFGLKSATFKASPVSIRDMACVDYKGKLLIYDIETGKEKYCV